MYPRVKCNYVRNNISLECRKIKNYINMRNILNIIHYMYDVPTPHCSLK